MSAISICPITTVFAIILQFSAVAQVRIQGDTGDGESLRHATILFNITVRVVAEEFHLRRDDLQLPITVVLGEERSGVVGDETTGIFTVYMPRWDDTLFATCVSRVALQHLISSDRKARIVRESLRRAGLVAPVSVSTLRRDRVTVPIQTPLISPRSAMAAETCAASSMTSPFPAARMDRYRSPSCPPGAPFAP